ncbi:MAG: hypothetical protein LBF88_11480 [Planctomycetaceae bacterium]|jgi:hypothetical protein|nr:hypothetical protein [Planctomycetaceae bacterium]
MVSKRDWLPGSRADQISMAKDWLLLLDRPTPWGGSVNSLLSLRSKDFRDKDAALQGQILF